MHDYICPRVFLKMEVEDRVHLRSLECELGVLERADGSARVVQGSTSVLCAVYGPTEVKMSKEQCDQATLDVLVKPASGLSSPKERQLEQLITGCCETAILTELHPHAAISITLQVENSAGGLFSTLIQSCCLALLDASIPLSSVFSCVSCGYSKEGVLIADPDQLQEEQCQSLLTFVVQEGSGDIITSYGEGNFTIDQMEKAMGVATEASKGIAAFYRQSVQRKLSKDAKFPHLQLSTSKSSN